MHWHFVKDWVFVGYLLSCVCPTVGQNLTIPTWQNPTLNSSRGVLEGLAHEAAQSLSTIDTLANTGLPRTPQDITSIYALLALQDYYSGNTSWRTDGVDNMDAYIRKNNFTGNGVPSLWSDVTYWGLALFYSYRTYKDSRLMDLAVSAWDETYNNAFITPEVAASGSGAGHNVSLLPPSNCTGGTYAGGVFYLQDSTDDTYVNMISLGPFMTLSAYLFEETNETQYQHAAQLSLDFSINHLWNGTFVYDGIYLNSCQLRPKPFSLNQAWFIEGMAIWANVTKNNTLTDLLQVVVASVTRFPSWTFDDGVLYDTDSEEDDADRILKGLYIRGLAEARRRNPGTDLARYIEAYITVQFNSIMNHARTVFPNGTSAYNVIWTGPVPTTFDAGGSIAALDVLNSAFDLVEHSEPSNSSTGGTGSNVTPKKSSNTGAIVGSVIGGVAAVVAAFAIMLFIRRRKQMKAIDVGDKGLSILPTSSVQPFMPVGAYTPTTSAISHKSQRSAPSPLVSSPVLDYDSARDQERDQEPIDVSELPSLMQRLNNFLQGRQGELPPRYVE